MPLPAAVSNGTGVGSQQSGGKPSERLLLLSPPSISSHPDKLNKIFESRSRDTTDLQMLDRLAAGLVSLPEATYDVIILLTDTDGTRTESSKLLNRQILQLVARALRPGGKFRSEDGSLGAAGTAEHTEAILAGLVVDEAGGLLKPNFGVQESVPLRLGKKKTNQAPAVGATDKAPASGTGSGLKSNGVPSVAGLGFVDFSDDFGVPPADGYGSDEELIDEEGLLGEDDMGRPIVQRTLLS